MNKSIIHHSWTPILKELNTDEFLFFKYEILPKEKYYPEADKVFRVFSMPVSSIKVVLVGSAKLPNIREKEEQGLFWLPLSLTSGVTIDHAPYWESFLKTVLYFIARSNPCIWLFPSHEAQRFIANLPRKSIFNVQRYTDETIQLIPLNEDYNYIFRGIYVNNLEYVNVILKKKGQKTINW
jgi:uracil-DNA glycosylase